MDLFGPLLAKWGS